MVRGAQQLVGVDRELVPLLALFADREEPHLGIGDLEDLLREDGAHVSELHEVLGPRVGVGARVDEHAATDLGRDHDRDRRAVHTADTTNMEKRRGQHGTRVPGRDGCVSLTVGNRANGAHERRVRLRANGVDGMVVHVDRLRGLDQGETVRVEARRPHQHRLDVVGRSVDGAADDLLGRMIPTQSVDCDANHARSIYGASRRSGSTSRPL